MKAKLLIIVLVLCGLFIAVNQSRACSNQSPIAILTVVPQTVIMGNSVTLNGSASYDPDGYIIKYEWDFTNDGTYDYVETFGDPDFDGITTHTYSEPGTYTVRLRVTDNQSSTDTDTCTVEVVYNVHNITQDKKYGYIQPAINGANDFDVIEVDTGLYYENIDFLGKKITLCSTNSNDWSVISATVICANDVNLPTVFFGSSEDSNSIIAGLKIMGGVHGIDCNSSSPIIRNCIIAKNGAENSYGGGIFSHNYCSPLITNCFIIDNDANRGGGIYNVNSNATIRNCVINENSASENGGGIYNQACSPKIINCTFIENDANNGGGMCNNGSSSEPNVTNCIFWVNSAKDSGNEIFNCGLAEPNLSYCDIEDCDGSSVDNWDTSFGIDGGGNIDQDPLLVNQVVDSNLVAYWKLDEDEGITAYDSIGSNHGTIYGASWTNGQVNSALDFDGDEDYVEIPDADSLTPSSKITISFWLYNRGGQNAGIYKYASCPNEQNSPGNSRAYVMAIGDSTGKAKLTIFSSVNNSDVIESNSIVPLNGWHHVAGTFNQGEAAIYIDGQLDNSTTMSVSSIMNDVQPLIIGGCWSYCGTDHFINTLNGTMDDVRIYDKALSVKEIQQLYQYGAVGHYYYRIDSNSLCINTGDPASDVNEAGFYDVDNHPRICGPRIDMGANEYCPVSNADENKYYFTIQAAIDDANDGDIIEVSAGTYYENVDFDGKAITLRSTDPNDPNVVSATIIDGNNVGDVITFNSSEGASSILEGITITGGQTGIYCGEATPRISNCLIIDNNSVGVSCDNDATLIVSNCEISGSRDGIVCYPNSVPTITFNNIYGNSDSGIISIMATPTINNNILYDNSKGITCIGYTSESLANNTIVNNTCYGITSLGCREPDVSNCILWGNGTNLENVDANYSCVEESDSGTGNISYCPYFADIDNKDFHLLSYSPCIDAGDPCSSYSNEPSPDGSRINMGAYGDTVEATSISADTDSDGLPDDWENAYLESLSEDGSDDTTDGDDANNLIEYRLGTRPDLSDTDGDGMSDGWEINNSLDPLDPSDAKGDLDGDGKSNIKEALSGSDPNISDVVIASATGTTIQAAINACTHDWDIVEVQQGTYQGAGNRGITFGNKKVIIRSENPNDPCIVASTIIDCEGLDLAFDISNSEGPEYVISGITIINGRGKDVSSEYYGGAIYCDGSCPTIEKCIFRNNEADEGGAIYNTTSSLPIISNCSFIDNSANGDGGAMQNYSSSPTLTDCVFINNAAGDDGGGLCNKNGSNGIFANCEFSGNYTLGNEGDNRDGGGIFNTDGGGGGSSPVFTNCVIINNTTIRDGGGACNTGSGTSPCYINCTFCNNVANDDGGGIANKGSGTATVTNCIIWGNQDGGDVYLSEDFDSTDASDAHFTIAYYTDWSVVADALPVYPSWSVDLGVLKQTADTGDSEEPDMRGTFVYYEQGSAWTDYRVNMVIRSDDDDAIGVMFRYQDQDNYYRFSWDKQKGYRRLVKCVDGSFTLLAEDKVAYTQIRTYGLEIVADGNELEIFVNGSSILLSTDDSLDSGTIALYSCYNSGSYFDNIIVSHPKRTGYGEYAQIYGETSDVTFSCIQDQDPLDSYIPFGGEEFGNTDDEPKFIRWFSKEGLVDYWKFDETGGITASDSIGDNDGELKQGPTWTTGQVNGSLSFDGTDDYVDLPDGFSDFADGLTIALWAYPTNTGNWAKFIDFGNGPASDNIVLARNLTSTTLTFEVYTNATSSGQINAASAIEVNKWQHFVVTLDTSGNAIIYKNGIEVASGSTALPKSVTRTCNYIGKSNWPNAYYQGRMDELVVFNRNLSPAEVEKLYQLGLNLDENIQLSSSSPCIDTGSDSAIDTNITNDIDGNIRIFDGDDNGTATVDMGAYEFDYDAYWSWGKVSEWSFDEGGGINAEDSAGDSNGTIHSAVWTNGKYGYALNFDGSSDYVDIDSDSNLSDISDNFTISFWANPSTTHQIDPEIISGVTGNSGQKYAVGPRQGDDQWGTGHAGTGISIGTNGISVYEHALSYMPPVLVWDGDANGLNHIAVVYKANRPRLYVNGQLKRIGLQSSEIVHAIPSQIGGHRHNDGTSGYGYFQGIIDEVMIYDRALSASEIGELAGNRPPVLGEVGDKTVVVEDLLTFTLTSIDADGDVVTYSSPNLPSGAELDDNVFSWRPEEGEDANYSVTFIASDGLTDDSETITIKVITEQLAAYWNFDETEFDIAHDSANGNDGTVYGMPWVSGKVGYGMYFDGSGDYIDCGLDDGLQIEDEISISAWIKAPAIPSGALWAIVSSQYDPGVGVSIILDGRANSDGHPSPERHIHFQIGNGSFHASNTNSVVPTDQWVHIVATRKANEDAKIYYNGVSQPLTSASWDGSVTYTQNWNIGRQPGNGGPRYFNGSVDEVMIFDKALDANEVNDIYQNGLNEIDGLTGIDEPNYPVSYWDCNEGIRNIVHDLVGDNNGIISSTPWTEGQINGALYFDGSGDYIDCGLDDGLQIEDEISISAWIKAPAIPSGALWAIVSSQYDPGVGVSIILDGRANSDGHPSPERHIHFQIGNGSFHASNTNSVVPTDQWVHIVATRKANEDAKIYYNGVSQPLTSASWDGSVTYTQNWNIGRQPGNGGPRYFNGSVDEVMIFDKALDANEVNDIYQNGLNEIDGLTGIDEPNYPVSYWKFDEERGHKAYDIIGNNDGDLKGDLNVTSWDAGVVENALNFSSDADYVVLEDMNDAYYSIGFWAKFVENGYWEGIVDFSGNSPFTIVRYSTTSQMAYRNGNNWIYSDSGFIINGEWHHYAVVQIIDGDSNRVIFYRDGLQYGKAKISTDNPTVASRTACYIGKYSTSYYFTGLLDELRIYERSLTEEEVEKLATNQNHPELTPIGNKSVDVNNLITFSLSAFDVDGDDIAYAVSGLPTGAVFNNSTFSWIPYDGQQGNYQVTFAISDGEFDDSETIAITVNDFNNVPQSVAKAVSGALGNDLGLQIDPFTGCVRYSVPIAVPPGRQGSEPSVSLNYTGGGNGWCGFGWSLGMGVIQRNTRYGVPVARDANGYLNYYDDGKGFVVSFGSINSQLVLVDDVNGVYRAETDQAFLKYVLDKTNNQWIVTDKSGNNFYFGQVEGEIPSETVGVSMCHPDFNDNGSNDTFLWALARILDKNGNSTYLDYTEDNGQIYLERIRYNGNINSNPEPAVLATHTVEFVLEDRPDASISFATGFPVEIDKRLSEIVVEVNDVLVRRYKLAYQISPSSKRSLLAYVTVFGSDDTTSLPPLVFDYQVNSFEFGDVQDWGPIDNQGSAADDADGKKWNSPSSTTTDKDSIEDLLDINGDGLPDRVMRKITSPYTVLKVQLNTGDGFETDVDGNYITREWGPVKTQDNDDDAGWGSIQGIDSDDDAHVMLLDIDVDGLPDRVMRNDVTDFNDPNNIFKVQLNTGFGFEAFTRYWTDVNSQGNITNKGWNSPHGSDGDGTLVTMLDINGDGIPDRVMRNNSASFAEPENVYKIQLGNEDNTFDDVMDWGPLDAQGYINDAAGKKWNSPNAKIDADSVVTLMDINGDGLPDRVMRKKDSGYTVFKVQFNNGYGFEADVNGAPITTDWGPIYTQGHDTDAAWGSIQAMDADGAHVMLFDISADGLPDRVMRNDVTDFSYPENIFKVQLNTGYGFEALARNWKNIDNQGQNTDVSINSPYGTDSDGVEAFLCDINGDGLPDRVMRKKSTGGFNAPQNVFKVQLNKGAAPDLLKKVTGKLGGSVEVTYKPSTKYDNRNNQGKNLLPFPMQTASSLIVRDGLGSKSTTDYNYSRGFFDTERREFRGFGKVEITDPCGTRSVTYFHQGGGYDDDDKGEFEDGISVAKKGIPYCVEIYGSDGLLYNRTINKIEEIEVMPETGWYFAYTSQTIKMDYEGLNGYRAKARSSEYDPNTGNILKSIDLGEVENVNIKEHTFDDIGDDSLFIHTIYETFNDPNILNKIKSSKTTSDSDGTNVLKQIFFAYDANVGRVLEKKTWLDANDSNTIVEYDYDQYGNKTETIDEVNIVTTIEYDSIYQMFPIKKTTGTFVTETTYDMNSGLPVTTKDVMGIVSKNVYDEFYRLTDMYISTEPNGEPNLWLTNIEYNLGGIIDGNMSNNFIRQRFDGYEAYTYSDGLGRIVQSRTKAESSADYEFRVVDKCYDSRGKVSYATTPFFDDGFAFSAWVSGRLSVLTEYDPVGRVYRVTPSADDNGSPTGSAIAAYADGSDPWAQVSTDPMGNVKKRYYDAKGRVIKLIEVITDGNDCEVEYTYDKLGRLTETEDSAGNIIKASYDSLGRKTDTNDPDMGCWTYEYDGVGRMVKQADSRGNTIELVYEPNNLGRLKEKKVYDCNDALVNDITYYYDTGDENHTVHKGLIYKVEDEEGWIKTSYDSLGRAVKTTRYITETDTSYVTETTYDAADRVVSITYPDDVAEIHYDYGSVGELICVRSTSGTGANEKFYEPKGFNEDGQLTGMSFGNGVRNQYDFYANSKRLQRIHTYKGSTDLQDLTYTFDKASNIKSITDTVYNGNASAGMSDIQYDDLYRLTSLYSVAKEDTVTYSYDALGNIITNGDYGSGTYLYQGSGYAHSQPHAVTSANSKSYSYDQCGNMTTRGSQTLTYNAENRLVNVSDSGASLDVSFGYAYDGGRLYKKNNNTSTVTQVWIGGIYEEKYDASRDRTLKLCHVYANGDLIATFEPESTWACIIQNTPFLARMHNILGRGYVCLFRGGRTPISLMAMAAFTGLAFGLYYNRRRLWIVYRMMNPSRAGIFFTHDPWRQVILLMMMTACILASVPEAAFADAPVYDPVFYYYHSDHLGSAMVMSDRDGHLVQQYGYTAFGNEHYKNNTYAFSVSNRYTGQQLDEDTGLYFYKSRYYDPELGRFTQADPVVPSANTSQALNRYSYVKNNPLKFTDPSGHGWFKKLWKSIKKYIGTIVTIALMATGVFIPFAAIIGSAISTAVNGGSFASFAVGVGVGIAAGVVAGAAGNGLFGASWVGTIESGTASLLDAAIYGALSGTAAGAIASAVYGQNVGKGLGEGAATGAVTGAAAYGARQYSNNARSQKASAGNQSVSHGRRLRVSTNVNIEEGAYVMGREVVKLAGDTIDPRLPYDKSAHWFFGTVEDLNNNGVLDTGELRTYSFLGRQVVSGGQNAWQSMLKADTNTALTAFQSGNNVLWNRIGDQTHIPLVRQEFSWLQAHKNVNWDVANYTCQHGRTELLNRVRNHINP